MKHKKRILFVIPSLRRAGAENQLVDLANTMDDSQFEKYVFTFSNNLDQHKRLDNEQVHSYNSPRKNRYDLSPVQEIASIIERERIDVVHCTLKFAHLLGWLGIQVANRKPALVGAMHTTLNRSAKEEIRDHLLYRWPLKASNSVIFVCNSQASHWIAKFPFLREKSTVIYNGIDVSHFDPLVAGERGVSLRRSLGISDDHIVISCIAGFRREKGHQDLIQAIAPCDEDTYLILVGDGETRNDVEMQVRRAGVENRVRFLGCLSDVRPVLSASDVTVIASTSVETFSIAMLESMSMGIPVIATKIGGLSEAISPGKTGELVPPGDPHTLCAAISRITEDKQKLVEMGWAARERVVKHFNRALMVRKTEQLLLSVANGEL